MTCSEFRSSSIRSRFVGSRRARVGTCIAGMGMAMAYMLVPAAFAIAQHTGTQSGHEAARAACSEEARAKNLAGNELDAFVADCAVRVPATRLQQHHEIVVTCNRQATQASLQGDARIRFVEECLRYHPAVPTEQEKMLQCDQRASQTGLRGEGKKKFADKCMRG